MKVLFTYIGFVPAVAWGGPVTVMYQNALALKEIGWDVEVCASNLLNKGSKIKPHSFKDNIDGIPVNYLNTYAYSRWRGTVGPSLISPSSCIDLWQAVREADIVHVHGFRNIISALSLLFAKWQSKPVVLQTHGGLPQIINSVYVKQVFDRLIFPYLISNVDKFFALQETEKKQIENIGVEVNKIHVISNGIYNSNFLREDYLGQFRDKYNISSSRPIILFLGRINHVKGVDLLIKAFVEVSKKTKKDPLLVIVGSDDGQLDEIQTIISQFNLKDNVLLTGLLKGRDVKAAYVDADIFVLPSRKDAFPMTVVEACQAQTPMVITEACEMAHLLDGRAATIVPVDVNEISNALFNLLEDEVLQKRYSNGAKILMEKEFSMESIVEQYNSIYQDVIAHHDTIYAVDE